MQKPHEKSNDVTTDQVPSLNFHQESWRVFQIMAEFVEGFEQLANIAPSVTMFGSARFASDHPYCHLAEQMAYQLSNAGFSIVTGGGLGIMEAANKGAFRGNSPSIGLNIALPKEQTANQYQEISLHFKHFFVRKVMLIKYASACVVLPGGFGTLDELAEILTLVQTQKSQQVPIILVQSTFWQGLLNWFKDSLLDSQTIDHDDLKLITMVDNPTEILDIISTYHEK